MIKVKKVSAFPFVVDFKTQAVSAQGQVVKLSTQGFMMETHNNYLRPGDRMEFSFTLPVLNHVIVATGTIIKIYSERAPAVSPTAPPTVKPVSAPAGPSVTPLASVGSAHYNLIEIHFKNLNIEQKNHLYDFLRKLQTSNAG